MEVLSVDNKIMTVNGKLAKAPSTTGTGDMKKSVYDPTGIVEATGGIPDYVEVSAPVTSVNSKTGAVQLNANDVGALPADTVIPTVNNATLTIRRNSVDVGSFTANSANDVNIDINVPTDKSDIGLGNVDNVKQYSATNPPPYPVTSVNSKTGAVTLTASDIGAATTNDIHTAINRTTAVNEADVNYTTLMARGEKLMAKATFDAVTDWSTELVNGAIAWGYE